MDDIRGRKKNAAFPATLEEFLDQGEKYYPICPLIVWYLAFTMVTCSLAGVEPH